MRNVITPVVLIVMAGVAFASGSEKVSGVRDSKKQGTAAYRFLDQLTTAPKQVTVHQTSSRNKHGYNGDENWPMYVDSHGDEVIFDVAGPGAITSIWGTNFEDDAILKFYFDGETKPRYEINQKDFFKGTHPHFPEPLVSYEKRGMWGMNPFAGNSFIRIPFEKHLKIAIQGNSRFFHVLYEKYPHGTPIKTFTGSEDQKALVDCFKNLGEDPTPQGLDVVRTEINTANPGEVFTVLSRSGSGIIRKIVIEGEGSVEMLRQTKITMHWDGHALQDVCSPTGIFFGCANHAVEMKTLSSRVEVFEDGHVRMTSYFPMPFWEGARISWKNETTRNLGPMKVEIFVDENDIDRAEGTYFNTIYHEGQTTYSKDWPLYENKGVGWLAGVVQTMRTHHYCEGDEHFYIDGAISPQINGTGSEDYYLGCFWPNINFNTPFACCVGNVAHEGGGYGPGSYAVPSCYARYHLESPIPFYSSIDARIQHGGMSNILSEYRSLAYCYIQKRPTLRQTDLIDVGNEFSESSHAYVASNAKPLTIEGRPEGEYFEMRIAESGRVHDGGEVTFKVGIDPANDGVRLRRLMDQGLPKQKAEVYIDDQYAGCWYHGHEAQDLRLYETDFDIHPDLTHGKKVLNVKLVIAGGEAFGDYTDLNYQVFCFEGDKPKAGATR